MVVGKAYVFRGTRENPRVAVAYVVTENTNQKLRKCKLVAIVQEYDLFEVKKEFILELPKHLYGVLADDDENEFNLDFNKLVYTYFAPIQHA